MVRRGWGEPSWSRGLVILWLFIICVMKLAWLRFNHTGFWISFLLLSFISHVQFVKLWPSLSYSCAILREFLQNLDQLIRILVVKGPSHTDLTKAIIWFIYCKWVYSSMFYSIFFFKPTERFWLDDAFYSLSNNSVICRWPKTFCLARLPPPFLLFFSSDVVQ